jgi:formylglycine-generating enzyme required for sulfatase activity
VAFSRNLVSKSMKNKYIILILTLFTNLNMWSQKVDNITFDAVNEDSLRITYDLELHLQVKDFQVSIFYSNDNGEHWSKIPEIRCTGDIGTKVLAGKDKRILWRIIDSVDNLKGNVGFKIVAAYKIDPLLSLEMVTVEGGSFLMGNDAAYPDEKPIHSVRLNRFQIGKFEVTQLQWRLVMGEDPSELHHTGCDNCPVERVNWELIQIFLQKLNEKTNKNYRLPTEAEWEYAARGGAHPKKRIYSGNDTLSKVAWFFDNYKTNLATDAFNASHPVGQKLPNELGIYDMSGNVWEWCNDLYGNYVGSAVDNPIGATTGTKRVYRGGSWSNESIFCRTTHRAFAEPVFRSGNLGFRLAISF